MTALTKEMREEFICKIERTMPKLEEPSLRDTQERLVTASFDGCHPAIAGMLAAGLQNYLKLHRGAYLDSIVRDTRGRNLEIHERCRHVPIFAETTRVLDITRDHNNRVRQYVHQRNERQTLLGRIASRAALCRTTEALAKTFPELAHLILDPKHLPVDPSTQPVNLVAALVKAGARLEVSHGTQG